MKKIIKYISVVAVILLIIFTPAAVSEGAQSGLKLWFYALIPALLPYMIISNIVIKSGLSMDLSFITLPVTRLLRIPDTASYCILSGIFFGYPACAVNACMLVEENRLDRESACLCACAFNNLSPGFIMGYFCIGTLKNKSYIPVVFALFYISLLLSTILIRILFFGKTAPTTGNIRDNKDRENIPGASVSGKNLLTDAIKISLVNMAVLGGYVIIFSIIIEYICMLPFWQTVFLTPLVEITSGITLIYSTFTDINKVLIIVMPFLSFGGISGIFQTFGIDRNGIIDKKKYIYSKVLSGMVCLAVTYIAVYVLKLVN